MPTHVHKHISGMPENRKCTDLLFRSNCSASNMSSTITHASSYLCSRQRYKEKLWSKPVFSEQADLVERKSDCRKGWLELGAQACFLFSRWRMSSYSQICTGQSGSENQVHLKGLLQNFLLGSCLLGFCFSFCNNARIIIYAYTVVFTMWVYSFSWLLPKAGNISSSSLI